MAGTAELFINGCACPQEVYDAKDKNSVEPVGGGGVTWQPCLLQFPWFFFFLLLGDAE